MSSIDIFSRDERSHAGIAPTGLGTRIAPFAHIEKSATIGRDCNICAHATIGNDAALGDRVTVQPGAYVHNETQIGDDVVVGANAAIGDPSGQEEIAQNSQVRTLIRKAAVIGPNATVLCGITVGERSRITAGSVVTRDVPPLAIVSGNPASIVGYEGISNLEEERIESRPVSVGSQPTRVSGVQLHRLPSAADMRGLLSYAEVGKHVPFDIKRFFLVYGVANQEVRGEHAHRTLHQFLICVHGRCNVVTDDGDNRQEFMLDDPTIGLHVPPMVWAVQYKHSSEAVLLVLASQPYDPGDYIRDYSEFLTALRRQEGR